MAKGEESTEDFRGIDRSCMSQDHPLKLPTDFSIHISGMMIKSWLEAFGWRCQIRPAIKLKVPSTVHENCNRSFFFVRKVLGADIKAKDH